MKGCKHGPCNYDTTGKCDCCTGLFPSSSQNKGSGFDPKMEFLPHFQTLHITLMVGSKLPLGGRV